MNITVPLKIEFDEKDLEKAIDKYVRDNPDMVEVVRCKDCKLWKCYDERYGVGKCQNPLNGFFAEFSDNEDYCSYGERREDTDGT